MVGKDFLLLSPVLGDGKRALRQPTSPSLQELPCHSLLQQALASFLAWSSPLWLSWDYAPFSMSTTWQMFSLLLCIHRHSANIIPVPIADSNIDPFGFSKIEQISHFFSIILSGITAFILFFSILILLKCPRVCPKVFSLFWFLSLVFLQTQSTVCILETLHEGHWDLIFPLFQAQRDVCFAFKITL